MDADVRSVIAGSSGYVKIWDLNSGKLKDSIFLGSAVLHIIWVDISSRRNMFLTACEDGSVCLYSRRSATLVNALRFKVFVPYFL